MGDDFGARGVAYVAVEAGGEVADEALGEFFVGFGGQ